VLLSGRSFSTMQAQEQEEEEEEGEEQGAPGGQAEQGRRARRLRPSALAGNIPDEKTAAPHRATPASAGSARGAREEEEEEEEAEEELDPIPPAPLLAPGRPVRAPGHRGEAKIRAPLEAVETRRDLSRPDGAAGLWL